MKNLLTFLSTIIIVMGSLTVVAQEPDTPVFTVYQQTPVIEPGSSGEWDGRYTDPGAALYDDGQFHMFRNGFQGWVAPVQIGYLTSPDGLVWTEVTEDPVLTTDEIPYAGVAALASSALVEDDGTWVLYFYTWDKQNNTRSGGVIGRATADDPLGPWTVDPDPVLTPGSAGSWDDLQVAAPSVHKTDDGYMMYYQGNSANADAGGIFYNKIGVAYSEDGIHWTKYDDPDTITAPYAESDPILAGEGDVAWHQPRVEKVEDGWVMVFRQIDRVRFEMVLRYATSADGITWTVAPDPVVEVGDVNRRGKFWYTATAYHDGTLYLYVEAAEGRGTSIYAVTAEIE